MRLRLWWSSTASRVARTGKNGRRLHMSASLRVTSLRPDKAAAFWLKTMHHVVQHVCRDRPDPSAGLHRPSPALTSLPSASSRCKSILSIVASPALPQAAGWTLELAASEGKDNEASVVDPAFLLLLGRPCSLFTRHNGAYRCGS